MNVIDYVAATGADENGCSSKTEVFGRAKIVRTRIGGSLYVSVEFPSAVENCGAGVRMPDSGATRSNCDR